MRFSGAEPGLGVVVKLCCVLKFPLFGQFGINPHDHCIRTYIETCARNGVNVFQALLRLTQNIPYSLQELCTACG